MLLVASVDSRLPGVSKEIMSAVNDLKANLVLAEEGSSITEALARRKYSTVWFVGHGDERGIWLSPTYCVSADTLIPSMRGRNISLIVLNICNSEALAYALHAGTGATVVYTEADVEDDTAFAVAKRFFCEIKNGASHLDAFNMSKSKHFQIINGYNMSNAEDKLDEIISLFHGLDKRISIIETKLEIRGTGRDKWYWTILILGLLLSAILFFWLWGDNGGWLSYKDYSTHSIPGMGGYISVRVFSGGW